MSFAGPEVAASFLDLEHPLDAALLEMLWQG